MSQSPGIYITLLLPCGKSWLLQRPCVVFDCESSDLGSIPSWDRLQKFTNDIRLLLKGSIHCPVAYNWHMMG